MVYLFIATVLGVLLSGLNINNYFLIFIISLSFILFLLVKERKEKLIMLILFLLFASILNTNLVLRDNYRDKEKISKVFTVKDIDNNKYILKEKNSRKYIKTYINKNYNRGDKILIKGNIYKFHHKMNELGYSEIRRNYSNNIFYKIKTYSSEKLDNGNILYKIQNSFISHCEKTLDKYLSYENSSILKSIILANTKYLDNDLKEDFRIAGISHILALSGLHIMIIMYFADLFLSIINISKVKRRVFALIIIYTYILFVGMPVGAIRSFIMSLILFLSFIIKKKYSSLDALMLSAIINIFISPYVIFSLSFIMSYISVLSILLFYKRFISFFNENFFTKSIALTLSVSILLFPINIYYFNSFSVISFISNLLVIPLYSISIILSFIIIIFSFLGIIISPFLNFIISFSVLLTKNINKLSRINITLNNFSIFSLIIYYVIIFIIFNFRKIKDFLLFKNIIPIYFILIFLLNTFIINFDETLYIDFLYVDQGDASLIRYKNKTYLVDTGGSYLENYSPGEIYTLNYLKNHSISKIDGLFISHFDADHIDGILDLLDSIKFENIYISYKEKNIYLDEILKRNINTYILKKDDLVKLGKNTYFKVLSNSEKYSNDNDKSLVLKLSNKNKSVLYTGDISENVERDIKEKVNVLKVSHHGSNTSTSEKFLKEISPDYAIISSGINNSYNHPHSDVIKRLKTNSISMYNTAKDGQISLSISSKIDIKSYRTQRRKNYINILLLIFFESLIFNLLIYKTRYLWITKTYIE